jgi:hypothetical protein
MNLDYRLCRHSLMPYLQTHSAAKVAISRAFAFAYDCWVSLSGTRSISQTKKSPKFPSTLFIPFEAVSQNNESNTPIFIIVCSNIKISLHAIQQIYN